MKNGSVKLLGLFSALAIVISSCKKDDDKDSVNGFEDVIFNPAITYGTMTDEDGNTYKTVIIGEQTWMAENLRTTKYNDGTSIPHVTESDEWGNLNSGAYSNFINTTNADTIAVYGRLYNWYAISTGKLAPTGWHVPTDEDWAILVEYLGGEMIAGGKLKEIGTTHWLSPNTSATNESGFTAIPAGYRTGAGDFEHNDDYGYWWSASEVDINTAWNRNLNSSYANIERNYNLKQTGYSIRCVKNN